MTAKSFRSRCQGFDPRDFVIPFCETVKVHELGSVDILSVGSKYHYDEFPGQGSEERSHQNDRL